MVFSALVPGEPLERQNEKLIKINTALMKRVEQVTDNAGAAYSQFERAAMLEQEVRTRTGELWRALDLLNESNAQLAAANAETEAARSNLFNAIEAVDEGFALFDEADVLVMYNSRFCIHMPDARAVFVPGLPFEDYVQILSESSHLALPDGERPAEWAARRRARHRDDHVIFNVQLTGDRWLQASEHRTPSGGTVILQTDVTDMMRLERQERERLIDDQARINRAMLDHISQAVCIFTGDARLASWNRRVSELLPIPLGRLTVGAGFSNVFAELLQGGPAAPFEGLLDWIRSGPPPHPFSFEIRQPSGATLAVVAKAMPDEGFLVSFTDVTAEREALRVISEANEMLERRVAERTTELQAAVKSAELANTTKTRFVAAASHDVLQPLSAAKLYLSALEAERTDEPIKGVVGKAQSAISSVEKILSALLDVSRLDSGRVHLQSVNVDVGDVLGRLAVEFKPAAQARGLSLRVVPSTAMVQTDPTYFMRILQNLIANAIRYTDSGGVVVGARHDGQCMRIEVWDTGPGICECDRQAMFREFHRLGRVVDASSGLGLGLAIVERACALLEHDLTVRSVVGRGTMFGVSVRLAEVPHCAPAELPSPELHRIFDEKIALLVEPDDELRRALAALLESWGVVVLDAGSEEDAASVMDDIGFDLDVILVGAPKNGSAAGAALLQRLSGGSGRVATCLLAGDRPSECIIEPRTMPDAIVNKPIETEALQRALTRCLAQF